MTEWYQNPWTFMTCFMLGGFAISAALHFIAWGTTFGHFWDKIG